MSPEPEGVRPVMLRLESALDCASRGWPVFPVHTIRAGRCSCGKDDCEHPGKHPHGQLAPHGVKDATADEAVIRAWWAEEPDANIGLATGAVSGLAVLDVDPRHGGDATLRRLLTEHGALPPTPISNTGGGGQHILLQHPRDGIKVKSKAGALGLGLDVKGDGGYIIAPTSLHISGRKYEWARDAHPSHVPVAPLPAWLLAKLADPPERSTASAMATERSIPEGSRNTRLTALGGVMRRRGMSKEAITAALLEENARRCVPPLTDTEVQSIADSVARYEPKLEPKHFTEAEIVKMSAVTHLEEVIITKPALERADEYWLFLGRVAQECDPIQRQALLAEASRRRAFPGVSREQLERDLLALVGGDRQDPGEAAFLTDPEPWPSPVDGAALLDQIKCALTRFVVLPDEAADAVALWILQAHAHEASDISPILAITSPVRRCGKTRLFGVLQGLVPRPLAASNITAAALFRTVEKYQPTLLIDEADTFLELSDEMRGLLNSGHTRHTAKVIRTVGDEHEPKEFSTWCPKAIALIGKLPETLTDRSIEIAMRRRTKNEPVERFRLAAALSELEPLRRKAARWAADHGQQLREANPEVPDELDDRAADNWGPLIAMADLAGGDWAMQAREAALALSGEDRRSDTTAGVQLLADIRQVFEEKKLDRLASTALVQILGGWPERPWGEWKHGKAITQRQVADLLRPFEIAPKVIRVGEATPRGYERADLEDAWARYLPPLSPSEGRSEAQHPQQKGRVADVADHTPVFRGESGDAVPASAKVLRQPVPPGTGPVTRTPGLAPPRVGPCPSCGRRMLISRDSQDTWRVIAHDLPDRTTCPGSNRVAPDQDPRAPVTPTPVPADGPQPPAPIRRTPVTVETSLVPSDGQPIKREPVRAEPRIERTPVR